MIDPEIDWFYSQGKEQARLESDCMLEAERTRRIILDRLPQQNYSIVDIGGAAGAYSFWLAGLGHAVTLVDPVELHIKQATAISQELGLKLQGYCQADARCLPLQDREFDVH